MDKCCAGVVADAKAFIDGVPWLGGRSGAGLPGRLDVATCSWSPSMANYLLSPQRPGVEMNWDWSNNWRGGSVYGTVGVVASQVVVFRDRNKEQGRQVGAVLEG